MNPNERFIQLLGLIKKAGKLAVGRMAVDRAVWSGKAYLLIVADDVAADTRKHYELMAEQNKLPLFTALSKETLGAAIGKNAKAGAAILDSGFAAALCRILEERRLSGN